MGHHESIRSVSSLGSAIPFNGSTHQQLLSNADNDASQSYMGSAWTYTVGMLSSIGTIFGGAGNEETQSAQYGQRRNHYNEQHHKMMSMTFTLIIHLMIIRDDLHCPTYQIIRMQIQIIKMCMVDMIDIRDEYRVQCH